MIVSVYWSLFSPTVRRKIILLTQLHLSEQYFSISVCPSVFPFILYLISTASKFLRLVEPFFSPDGTKLDFSSVTSVDFVICPHLLKTRQPGFSLT